MSKISIACPQDILAVDRGRIREVARAVLEGEGIADHEISVAFVDNPTIHRLNKRYLNHDEPTDVLSFPLSDADARKLAGELVVGVEVAKEQAERRGHDVHAELALYVIHGLLHLCGYDDKSDATAAACANGNGTILDRWDCRTSRKINNSIIPSRGVRYSEPRGWSRLPAGFGVPHPAAWIRYLPCRSKRRTPW